MSSADPRAAEATAWQRAILDELGAPRAGLARLSPRGTPAPGPRPTDARDTEPQDTRSRDAVVTGTDPYGPAPRRVTASTPARQPPARQPPAAPAMSRQEHVFGTPRIPETTAFDPSPPARPQPHRNTAAETRLDPHPAGPPSRGPDAAPVNAPPWRDRPPLKTPVTRTPGPPRAEPHPESLLRRARHGDPMLRRLAREVRKVTGASQDSYQDTTLAEAIRQPITTGRRIAVTSIRGGAGKSVVSALIATAMAHFRQDRVLAVDADPGIGSLMLRLGMTGAPSLRNLTGTRIGDASFDAVRPYLAQTDAGVWALGGSEDRFAEVELETYRTATNLLGRFFGVTVIDCGAGLTGELVEGILADAHAHVLVTPATPDGAISARRALNLLATHGEKATRTALVFVTHANGAGLDVDRTIKTMPPSCPCVEHLAFDRHLADGSVIDPARLAEPTRVTALRIAAAALTLAAGRSVPR